ncbi:uncharacterized protein TNCV_2396071 [Trichonephila clavipes]|uniref:Uncharacterized protein n=1 Tax=Trichonephila clavipes TaxID=2585209 RepID=A0A8X6T4F0_TRICX|nr:uncharacterized protein TNCV_2396071 [Trichonephila clavipes]
MTKMMPELALHRAKKRRENEKKKEQVKKRLCPTILDGLSYQPPSIHRRYPTTAQCGSFCLLRFRPGPFRFSLDDLVIPSSLRCTISTLCLARTPDRHRKAEDRTPNLTPSNSLDLQSSWIIRPRHRSRSFLGHQSLPPTDLGRVDEKMASPAVVTSLGARDPEKIADFTTRSMAQNFKVFTREEMIRVYAGFAASYLGSQRILTQDCTKDLANTYEKSANETVVEDDPTSKFKAVENELTEFLMSEDTLTGENCWKGAIC